MHRSWLVAAILVAASLALGTGAALPAEKHIKLEADDGQGCNADPNVQVPPSELDCFRVVNGSLDGFQQGMRVHLMLENVGDNSHNAYAADSADADGNHIDTAASAAINNTETIDPGENTSMMVQVPSDAEGLYIWCDVQGHEAAGMWLNTTVEAAPDDSNTTDGGQDGNQTDGEASTETEEGTNPLPAPGGLVLAGAASLAALIQRRRGRR